MLNTFHSLAVSICFFIGLAFFLTTDALAQSSELKEKILAARVKHVESKFSESHISNIITGRRYDIRYHNVVNSPLYLGAEPRMETLVYDGVRLEDIELQFDLYEQLVVVLLESKRNERYVTIDSKKVDSFTIGDDYFVNVSGDLSMGNGLYQLAHDGQHSQLYIKRKKGRIVKVVDGRELTRYIPQFSYFVKNQFGTYEIGSKKSILEAYKNSNSVEEILKSSNAKFGAKKIEETLLKVIPLIDNLDPSIVFDG